MQSRLSKLGSGRLGVYVQFSVLLLLTAAVVVIVLSMSACNGCDGSRMVSVLDTTFYTRSFNDIYRVDSYPNSFQCVLGATEVVVSPGARISRTIGGEALISPPPSYIDYQWYPPEESGNFDWGGNPPDNPSGPAPYMWSNVSPSATITVELDMPMLPAGTDFHYVTDVLSAFHSDETFSHAFLHTALANQDGKQAALAALASAEQEASYLVREPGDGSEQWSAGRLVNVQGITLTAGLTSDWLGLMKSDDAYLAVRTPVDSAGRSINQSIPVPMMGRFYPQSELYLGQGDGTFMRGQVGLRPNRFAFAKNNLPSNPGEEYVALGLASSDPPTSPPDLELSGAGGGWDVGGQVLLDMSFMPDSGEGTELTIYYCYEGNEQPLVPPAVAKLATQMLANREGSGVSAFQDEGMTCIGPDILILDSELDWELDGPTSQQVNPGMPVSMAHTITNLLSGNPIPPLTFTLSIDSELSAGWGLYSDSGCSTPLTGEFVVDSDDRDFQVCGQIPSGAVSGPYTVTVSASRVGASETRVAIDQLWVGEWVVPPPHVIYLPLVVR